MMNQGFDGMTAYEEHMASLPDDSVWDGWGDPELGDGDDEDYAEPGLACLGVCLYRVACKLWCDANEAKRLAEIAADDLPF